MTLTNKSIILYGQPGSGKTTLANNLQSYLTTIYIDSFIVDGDVVRNITGNKDYTEVGRIKNNLDALNIAIEESSKGKFIIFAMVLPYKSLRKIISRVMDSKSFFLETTEIRGRENYFAKDFERDNISINISTDGKEEDTLEKLIPNIMNGKPWSIFIGRYQPFHNGHKWLIDQKLKDSPVLIMVRDILPDSKNPYTTQQTLDMIRLAYEGNPYVKVMEIPDIESVNYGRGVGYEINEHIPNYDIKGISATKIRESIGDNDDWKQFVPKDIINYLEEIK